MKIVIALCAPLIAAFPVTATAQEAAPGEPNVFAGDRLTVGLGVIYGPSYDGSDDYVVSPVPVLQGSDVGVALELLCAGLRGAALNVRANLGSIEDAGWVAGVRSEVERLEAAAPLLAADARAALGT